MELPDDPCLEKRLRRKLQEYGKRIIDETTEVHHPDDLSFRIAIDAYHKYAVLFALLTLKRIDTEKVLINLALGGKRLGHFKPDIELFDNSCGVISVYCEELDTTVGGTGLPE